MTPENLLGEWSRLLFESFADAGLRDVIVSPGSRSTPLAFAALSCSRLAATSVVDERSAAFYAVGHARITGRPVALVCTSGSALANYFPAVVEASMARVPLLLVTADRPFELMDCGAPQTLDQTKIYGDYVRRFVDLGMPDPAEPSLAAVRRIAAQTFFAATHGEVPGPVHLNVRARKPLEPVKGDSAAAKDLSARVAARLRAPITAVSPPRRIAAEKAITAIAEDLAGAVRGLVVCGPAGIAAGGATAALSRLARATGFPVYAETTSQHRFSAPGVPEALAADGLDLVLRSARCRDALRVDVVLQVGDAPTSSAWERFVAARPELVRHAVTEQGWPDPASSLRSLVVADVADCLSRIAETVERRAARPNAAFAERISSANRAAFGVVDALLASETALSEGRAVRAVVDALPAGAVFAVGNSLPVRHVDAFCGARATGITVWSQRGVSGIDGVVSGAAGACAAAGRPTVLLVGDVSALHDLGGFAVAARAAAPFVVVILNNDGGRIFEQLPLSDAGVAEDAFRFWTTPHGRDFDGLAPLFGVRHARVSEAPALERALTEGLARPGCSVVEVSVPPHGARDQYRDLARRLDAALAPLAGALGE